MKTPIYYLALSLFCLFYFSCSRENEIDLNPTPNLNNGPFTCKVGQIEDLNGGITNIIDSDPAGRILTANYIPSPHTDLRVEYNFNYNLEGKLIGGHNTVYRGPLKSVTRSMIFTYDTNGNIIKCEINCNECGAQKTEYSLEVQYNKVNHIDLLIHQDWITGSAITERYVSDADGNILYCRIYNADGQMMRQTKYTYDDVKSPEQLMTGLPFNIFTYQNPWKVWKVNMPLSIEENFLDEFGVKRNQEMRRNEIRVNAKGFATSIRYTDGPFETYHFPCN